MRSQLGYIVTSHSNKYVCNIKDCVEEDEHKMQIQYEFARNAKRGAPKKQTGRPKNSEKALSKY